jgi:hypothetical protein
MYIDSLLLTFSSLCNSLWNGILNVLLLLCNYQAAQRASENAFRLPRVYEQVHKVVMAANRAATAARVAAIKAVQNRMDGKFCDTYV